VGGSNLDIEDYRWVSRRLIGLSVDDVIRAFSLFLVELLGGSDCWALLVGGSIGPSHMIEKTIIMHGCAIGVQYAHG
jgi:hypothetical protein